jgi:hypothetical protein
VFEANREGIKWDFERDLRGRLVSKQEFERRENFTAYDCQKILKKNNIKNFVSKTPVYGAIKNPDFFIDFSSFGFLYSK